MGGESPSPEALEDYYSEAAMSLKPLTATEIKLFRQQTGLSQAALAEHLEASARTVEDWEAGKRSAPGMLRLAFAAILNQIEPWDPTGAAGGRILRAGKN